MGLLATNRSRSLAAPGANQVLGIDANFSFFQSVNLVGYYARSRTPGMKGRDYSYRARFEYAGDRYGLEVERLAVAEHFNPEVGFLRREDFTRNFAQARFSPRPKTIDAIRKINFETSLDYTTNVRGELETRTTQGSMRMELSNGDTFNVEYERNFEFLIEPFAIASGIDVPTGGYHFPNLRTMYHFGPQRPVSGWVSFARGRFYGGDRTDASYRGRLELTPRFSLEPALSVNWVDLPQGRFTTKLASARTTFTFSPQVAAAALLQYNSAANLMTMNLRFRWEYEPGSDLFVVYSDGRDTLRPGFPSLVNRSLAVKLTRLFRF